MNAAGENGAVGALADLRVVDLSRYGPGLLAAMMLGDMGADVIHLEEPAHSLPANRRIAVDPQGRSEREIAAYAPNRNKRSIVVNLKNADGVGVALRLMSQADIVLEGFRPGVAHRLGIDYNSVRSSNPGVIYCSISGYGQDGPYASRAGHDLNYVALTGILNRTRSASGEPVVLGAQVGDFGGGTLHALVGILTALHHRERTGLGQFIDAAMADGLMALATNTFTRYFSGLEDGGDDRVRLTGAAPFYHVYKTSDGRWLSVACVELHLWREFCAAMDVPELAETYGDEERWPEVVARLEELFARRTLDEWDAALEQANAAVARVESVATAAEDQHLLARGLIWQGINQDGDSVNHVAPTLGLSETPGSIRSLAPRRGEHTDEILNGLGYSGAEVAKLRDIGAVATAEESAVT